MNVGGFLNVGSAPVEYTVMFIAPRLTLRYAFLF